MTHGELITHDSSLVRPLFCMFKVPCNSINTMTAGTGKFACINGLALCYNTKPF